ncbi:MAG: hypothetical protein WA862_06800 [Solirubrobacterales bacterium]
MNRNPDREIQGSKPRRRHRAIVWPLIVIASVLLVFSISANWVQTQLLETDEVTATTQEIVTDDDAQEQLSIFLVDQLYATVDVQGQIEERLPPPVQPLAAPIGGAVRQLAADAAARALADPRVGSLISTAVAGAHEQFVQLIEDEAQYTSTTGNEVTIQYGDLVADLAVRLGLDPATISDIRAIVQTFSADLREGLGAAQTRLVSARAGLDEAQEGELSPELQQDLTEFRTKAAGPQKTIAGLQEEIQGVEDKVPAELRSRLSDLESRLADIEQRLSGLGRLTGAVLNDPTEANQDALDAALATFEAQITTLLERQVVQNPGQLVVMDTDQLDAVQSIVSALRNLGIVLPLLVLLLYATAFWLAVGWRSQALVAAGTGILAATLLLLLALRVLGAELVSSLASSESVEPAVQSVWDAISGGLRERALFILVIGLAFIGAGLLAGPGRHAVARRRQLTPYLHSSRAAVYSVLAGILLLWLAFIPAIDNVGQVIAIVLLGVLAVVGVEALRRQTAREFPERLDVHDHP